jgi:hypothetical protein
VSGFRASLAADLRRAFLDLDAFGEPVTVEYDGEVYHGVQAVVSGPAESGRAIRRADTDYTQGLYKVAAIFHCAAPDIGGELPEHGARFKLGRGCDGGFLREYRVAESACDGGMLRLELEAVDE